MGTRPPSLYVYFPSKHALYDALFARGAQLVLDHSRTHAQSREIDGAALDDVLLRLAQSCVRWSVEHPAYTQLLFWRPVPGFSPSAEAHAPAIQLVELSHTRFQPLREQGLIRPDTHVDEVHRDWTILLAGVVSQQLSNAPDGTFATGRFTTALPGLVAMFARRLRWIAFSHLEADECGAVDEFREVAPHAQVAHGALGVMLSLQDQLPRAPRPLEDGEVIDIGGASLARRVIEIATPHVPHNWESHMFFERETGTLFLGDLLTQLGNGPAVTSDDILDGAIAAEDLFHQTSLGPAVPATYRRLADLKPTRLAIMHGSSYDGDCSALLVHPRPVLTRSAAPFRRDPQPQRRSPSRRP